MRVCREDKEMALGTCSIRDEAIIPVGGQAFERKTEDKEETTEGKVIHEWDHDLPEHYST